VILQENQQYDSTIWRLLMSWKKWMVALATFAVTTQVTPASADRYDNCCPSSDCGFSFCDMDPCDGWSIYVDWLYWRTRKCDLDYAVSGSLVDFGPVDDILAVDSVHSVHPSWDSGVRFGVLKSLGDMDVGIHYTYFQSKDSNSATPGGDFILLPTLFNSFGLLPATASGTYDVTLHQVDVEAGYHLEVSDCLAGRMFTGFRYANIEQKNRHRASVVVDDLLGLIGPAASLNRKVDMDFYGLYLGSKASYKMFDCLDFFGGFSIGVGAAEFDRSLSTEVTLGPDGELLPDFLTTSDLSDSCWKTVTVVDLNVGVTFPVCTFCCVDWAFSVGYEFHHWIGTLDFLNKVTDSTVDLDGLGIIGGAQHFDRHTDNIGFDGLFVRVSAAF
jgi:hypothetical protein